MINTKTRFNTIKINTETIFDIIPLGSQCIILKYTAVMKCIAFIQRIACPEHYVMYPYSDKRQSAMIVLGTLFLNLLLSACCLMHQIVKLKPKYANMPAEHFRSCFFYTVVQYEPRCEKTGLRGFRPGPTPTGLYNHRRWLEA